MLTDEQKRMMVNLAMTVEMGLTDPYSLLRIMAKYPRFEQQLVLFWQTFNQMTRNALERLAYERCRLHLEKCFTLSSKGGK